MFVLEEISTRRERRLPTKSARHHKSNRAFNRQSVQEALRSLSHRLSLIRTTPPNGLAVFSGFGRSKDEKEKKIVSCLEPFKALPHSMYKCDSRFHTEPLREQLDCNQTFGFIIVDGNATTFHTLSGTARETIFKWEVSLPKKHGRGGQSKNRFERIRQEKLGWYISRVSESATAHFINPSLSLPNVNCLILAGAADMKHHLKEVLDPRLGNIVVAVVDIQYGGETGFSEAIKLTQDKLADFKYVQEQRAVSKFFLGVTMNPDMVVFGLKETLYALESGSLETLILWNNSELVLPDEFKPKENGEEEKSDEPLLVLDWVLDKYKSFGANVELVSDQTDVGSQFVKGFGGIGGTLRYALSIPEMDDIEKGDEDDFEYTW